MTISFTRTRNQIADMVLGKLGVIAAGETAPTADYTLVYEAIDLRLKEMNRLGVFWRNVGKTPLSFTVTSGVNSASASVDIAYPISLHIVDSSVDWKVELIDIRTYAAIGNKAEAGLPTKALYMGSAGFTFWPVPTATTTAKLVYESIADDTSASAAIDVDISMVRWIRDMVAYDIADFYGKNDTTILRLASESKTAEHNIRALAVQHVDYSEVIVDDFSPRNRTSTETDYGPGRW